MSIDIRRKVHIPTWIMLVLLGIISIGWMLAAFLLGHLAENSTFTKDITSPLLLDLARTILIGVSVGAFIDYYLKRATEPGPRALLEAHGIGNLYTSRHAAANDFLQEIKNPKNRTIYMAGISLRDFLTSGGMLQNVSTEIWNRLRDEEQRGVAPKDRLRVRLLLLDPKSGEGIFRQHVEKGTIAAGGIESDTPIAIGRIQNVTRDIYNKDNSEFLELRLYEHCPFAFLFLSENYALAEQYYYRDHTRRASLPLIQYTRDREQHIQLLHSYEIIWEHARPARVAEHEVGVAESVRHARIRNIFRHTARYKLGQRQIEIIRTAKPGDTISIQAITGRFYLQSALGIIRDISSEKRPDGAATIRFLIINPVSQQAIVRSVVESSPQSNIERALASWGWDEHSSSHLYTDAWQVIRKCNELRRAGHKVELRLTPAPLTSSLLLSSESGFIEQYVYGRSKNSQQGFVLGAEYPVLEFEMGKGEEQDILQSAFEVMWNWFSIPLDDYLHVDERENFEINLKLVRAYRSEENPKAQSDVQTPMPVPAQGGSDNGGRSGETGVQ